MTSFTISSALRTSASVIGGICLSTSVYAADPVLPAAGPQHPLATNWDGFYLGGHVGYALGSSSYSNSDNPLALGTAGVAGDDGQFGPVNAGLHAGYSRLISSGLLVGLEAGFSVPDTMQSNVPVVSPAGTFNIEDRIKMYDSLRGRVGFAFGHWLLYGAAGFAYDNSVATKSDADGNTDSVYFSRLGWTCGTGVEVRLTPNWSARLEYSYFDFRRHNVSFPILGGDYNSNLGLQTVSLGLNYWFTDGSRNSGSDKGVLGRPEDWSIHGQSTVIGSGSVPFSAAYSGPNSLSPKLQGIETVSISGFLGYRVVEGTEIYYNPEIFQGFGLSGTHGIAGFPNNEAQKGGFDYPVYKSSRLFVRQTFGLGGEQETLSDGPNQVSDKVDVSRLVVTAGKFSITDIFDNNAYAHDARSSFLNYALVDAGAFDYAGDQTGYSWGSVLELNQKYWAVRAGYFLGASVSNSNSYDTHIGRGQYLVEFEGRYSLVGEQGKVRFTGWWSECNCGSYAEALAAYTQTSSASDSNGPDITTTRRTRSEYGYIINLEQAVSDNLGLFMRLSWQNGQTEIMQFTDIDRSASFGGVLNGNLWGRPTDRIGLAGVVNGLSQNSQAFFAAGGLGLLIGDGALSYRPEMILETYYLIGINDWSKLTFDYQFVANPGYNSRRGPASIGSTRLHFEF